MVEAFRDKFNTVLLYILLYYLSCSIYPNKYFRRRPDRGTCPPPTSRHANNFMPPQTDNLQNFSAYDRAGETFLRTRTQIAENFRKPPFACGGLTLLVPYLGLFQRRLSARGRRPAGHPIILDPSQSIVNSVHTA